MATTYNVYRQIDGDVNPPTLIASGLTSPTYTDSTIVIGLVYTYTVGVVFNDIEKIGAKTTINTKPKINKVEILITTDDQFSDYGTLNLTWTYSGITFSHVNNEVLINDDSYIRTTDTFNWAGAWDIEFDVYVDSSISIPYQIIVSNLYNGWSTGGFIIFFGGSGSSDYERDRFAFGNYGANSIVSNVTSKDTWHHIRCIKTADHKYTMYIDDVLQFSDTQTNISDRNPVNGVINFGRVVANISGAGIRFRNFIIH